MKRIRKTKKRYYTNRKSKSVYDSAGRIICFSYQDFIDKVVKGDHCFLCGEQSKIKPFNSEHIIPNWILKRYRDEDSFMVLPNGTEIKNSAYRIPCCFQCNSELGNRLESPMSELLTKDYKEIRKELEDDRVLYKKIYHWAALIFFKTHLKDKYLLKDRDKRSQSGVISDDYCWECLYTIHNIVRKNYAGAKMADSAYGTVLIYESLQEQKNESFDYLDNLNSELVMIKVGSVVIFVALTDCKACQILYKTFLGKITGSLTTAQIRELFARLRYVIENLKNRPKFSTVFNGKVPVIRAIVDNRLVMYEGEAERKSLFELMRFYIGEAMPLDLPNRGDLLKDIEEGKAQYIFDENYKFFQHGPFKDTD